MPKLTLGTVIEDLKREHEISELTKLLKTRTPATNRGSFLSNAKVCKIPA